MNNSWICMNVKWNDLWFMNLVHESNSWIFSSWIRFMNKVHELFMNRDSWNMFHLTLMNLIHELVHELGSSTSSWIRFMNYHEFSSWTVHEQRFMKYVPYKMQHFREHLQRFFEILPLDYIGYIILGWPRWPFARIVYIKYVRYCSITTDQAL